MENPQDRLSEAVSLQPKHTPPIAPAAEAPHPDQHPAAPPTTAAVRPPSHHWRKWLLVAAAVIGAAVGAYFLVPWVVTALNTVSTDDAYVNGHVTLVAPRVEGQVRKVLVDDNYRVKKGDVLVRLDKVPYQVQVAIKKAAVSAAERDLTAAQAQARGLVAQTRSYRFKLEHAIEDVNTQVADLRAKVATLNRRKAALVLARANLKRGKALEPGGGISKEDLDLRKESVQVAEATVEEALQAIYAARVDLGLPAQPDKGQDLSQVPRDLDQNFSTVRQALGTLLQSAAQLGYFPTSWDAKPKQAIADFYKQDPEGNLDRIYARIVRQAPAVKQAEARLRQAERDLDQAKLNLSYCDIVSEIDGVVTRRNVNPGNNVQVGQSLMAVRSLRDIWIDANFKETQLADLRIGQRVRLEVDMYGRRRDFEGRISGFTMGTGSTLALLPPQNATGNFVKIVQRLPVRIEVTDYDPDQVPLFVGLSVVPHVYYKEPPAGPNAGAVLQPFSPLPKGPTDPRP
ncbi:MAG TPA: efflux RND transporter periplasmic adaptor subunit [Gemmataceae bacterium]|jgi:membrane fusion protein (multidrug efflux system)|nr:efflux RND transporter periplasmic adaptor subunit [Gemmataceae bacterium]